METNDHKRIGRAKTVLVWGSDSQQIGMISSIMVRTIEPSGQDRLCFCGQVGFSIQVRDHINTMLLPIVDRITDALGLSPKKYEISAVNLAAASVNEMGIGVSGFSADIPILIAMLSAALQIPVSQRILATGHIASMAGDITAVRSIPAKLHAAMSDDSIDTFMFPSDCNRIDEYSEAIITARDHLQIQAVENIGPVIEMIFTRADIIIAALKQGFWDVSQKAVKTTDPISQVVELLGGGHEAQFWSTLRHNLLGGKIKQTKELLEIFADYYIRHKHYPCHFGSTLFNLICSTPPAVRRLKNCFPLLDTGICMALSRFAKDSDYVDVPKLLDAAGGRNMIPAHETADISTGSADEKNAPDELFDQVVSELNEQAFAKKYGIPIDSARGCFVLTSVTVNSYQEFIDTVVSFYIHLRCYINPVSVECINVETSRNEALHLLQAAYRNEGLETAFQRALDGIDGGMRTLLNRLTEEYKKQQQSKYIHRVLTDALNSLRWTDRVAFMQSAMRRLKNFLPPEITNEPPERFARDPERIVKAYVESMDQFNRIISKF